MRTKGRGKRRPQSSPEHFNDNDAGTSRPIFCLKTEDGMKEAEEKEDCFILDYPMDQQIGSSNDAGKGVSEDDDVVVISEKGEVACRDYPHSRHLCVKYRFDETPHESYCELCFCFVCDKRAPCMKWSDHCNADDSEVVAVGDGLKAWELPRGKPQTTDLILKEVDWPSVPGFVYLTLIMEHVMWKNTPVIIYK